MRLHFLTLLALATQNINGASLPGANNGLHALGEHADSLARAADIVSPDHTLERRKGGGGRGGGSSGGSSGGGGRSSGGGGGGSRTLGSSSVGGQTSAGSGPTRSYGGRYGGGAAVPYQAGSRTPKGLVAGALLAPVAVLAFMPGIWLWSVYPYYYNNQYRFYNRTANATNNNNNNLNKRQNNVGANETLPVVCLCQEYAVCGCDENQDQSYLNDLVGNGSYAALNKSLVTVSQKDGVKTLFINGTLPNGTTAPGGVDDAAVALGLGKYTGYWMMGLIVLYGVML